MDGFWRAGSKEVFTENNLCLALELLQFLFLVSCFHVLEQKEGKSGACIPASASSSLGSSST